MSGDRLIAKLEALIRKDLVLTQQALILPIGSSGYAVDEFGNIIGLKIGSILGKTDPEVLELICQLQHLERLVLALETDDLSQLSSLKTNNLTFIWIGGRRIKSLPEELFRLDLPLIITGERLDFIPRRLATKLSEIEAKSFDEIHSLRNQDQDVQALSQQVDLRRIVKEEEIRGKAIEERLKREILSQKSLKNDLLHVKGLVISSISVEDPPLEILRQGKTAVLQYFSERAEGSELLNEVKVLLVGAGGSGKTSLLKKLLGETFDPKETQTHGINIRPWSLSSPARELTVHLWDFGGQEIMHATHQFFLSKRSLYILVLDGRKEEDAEYWLQHIESFGGDSPVIVILNKIDENPAFEVNRRFLQSKYRGIAGFIRLSCATGAGLDDLRDSLNEQLVLVPMLQTRWPKAWFNVKRRLQETDRSHISLDEYRMICARENVTEATGQETLVDFLHDLGVVLHFKDIELLDTHVLDPHWVTEAVYRIINAEVLAKQRGVLHLRQLGPILAIGSAEFKYTPDKYHYIIDLMLKFELCYRLGTDSILVPDLLDIQEPPLIKFDFPPLRFVFEYSYLPKSIMPRFIVRMHGDILDGLLWRTGVTLEDRSLNSKALVIADEKARRIYIHVYGKQKRDYFSAIRKMILDISNSFEKLPFLELVPLPDVPDVLLDYRELVGHEVAARSEIFVGRLGRAYNVSALLSGIEPKAERDVAAQTVINIQGDYFDNSDRRMRSESNDHVKEPGQNMSRHVQGWEKIVVYSTGVLFAGLVIFLAVRNTPFADPNIVVFMRILLSMVVAVFGAVVPGMLSVDFSAKGLTIRAIGALALFVITFLLTPKVL